MSPELPDYVVGGKYVDRHAIYHEEYFYEEFQKVLVPGMLVHIRGDVFEDDKNRYGLVVADERKQSSSNEQTAMVTPYRTVEGDKDHPIFADADSFRTRDIRIMACTACNSKYSVLIPNMHIYLQCLTACIFQKITIIKGLHFILKYHVVNPVPISFAMVIVQRTILLNDAYHLTYLQIQYTDANIVSRQ